jgi:glutamate synthase (NADPH/NADH) large chain
VAIPALLATSAVHQHLVERGLRTSTGLVVETGSAREVHHFALLAGYGAEAVHPYLAMETLAHEFAHAPGGVTAEEAVAHYVKAIDKGLQKVMSKMGISTYMSYTGAQIFEAVGLSRALVDKYFTGTASHIEGIGLFEVAEEALRVHAAAWGADPVLADALADGGDYAWRVRGEEHLWTPDAIAKLQHATRANNPATYAGIRGAHQRPEPPPHDAAWPVRVQVRPRGRPSRWTRWSRPRRSSSASPPARCRWARSPPRRTPRWPWR